MAALHQMGHDSENLLRELDLSRLAGAILSPVNYERDKVVGQIAQARQQDRFNVIFDPQLYFPNSERGQLSTWSYFPADVDTADLTDEGWWTAVVQGIAEEVKSLSTDAVCSPAIVPRTFEDSYFETSVLACEKMVDALAGSPVKSMITAVVGLADLTMSGRPLAVASILSRAPTNEVFLVFIGHTEPRRELNDPEELKGAMRLIRALENADLRVTVGFCSSDMLLWKHAGASNCASGKFFNLRRFTRNRFDEPSGGGGQLPYWYEESLFAFLRESDLLRVRDANLLSDSSLRNPFGISILGQLDTAPGTAWVAKSWRQYLWWFADAEHRLSSNSLDLPQALKQVEQTWLNIDDRILMEEVTNNGSWIRSWRRAVLEFAQS